MLGLGPICRAGVDSIKLDTEQKDLSRMCKSSLRVAMGMAMRYRGRMIQALGKGFEFQSGYKTLDYHTLWIQGKSWLPATPPIRVGMRKAFLIPGSTWLST